MMMMLISSKKKSEGVQLALGERCSTRKQQQQVCKARLHWRKWLELLFLGKLSLALFYFFLLREKRRTYVGC